MSSPARRPILGALVALAALVALLAVPAPSPGDDRSQASARVKPADRPWTGYAIPRTRRAASGWIGARRLAPSTVVYRTDPRRRATTRAFAEARTTRSFRASGGRRVGPARTACAALLLGRYGVPARSSSPFERRQQVAAVDVAVQHLLHGRGYRYDGLAQRRRTDKLAVGPRIRAYAEKLLDSCALSGPYDVTLTGSQEQLDVGGAVRYEAQVRSRTGVPVPDVALFVTPGDGSGSSELRTDEEGRINLTVRATRAGPLTTQIVARRVVPSQLRYLLPTNPAASRVVQAGIKLGEAYARSDTVAVKGNPFLESLGLKGARRAAPFRLALILRNSYDSRRTATIEVFGPYEYDGPSPDCRADKRIRRTRLVIAGNGRYRTGELSISRRGLYGWGVSVAGDQYNAPTADPCGGLLAVD